MKIYKVTNYGQYDEEQREDLFRKEEDAIAFAIEKYSSRYRGTFLAFNVETEKFSNSDYIRFRITRCWIPDEEDEDNDNDVYDITVVKEVEVK